MVSPYCPEYAPFFGFLGAALALVFGNMGAAYGTWKSALGLATISKLPRHKVQTEMVMKSIMPVILSGVCGIFGLIIAVIISSGMRLPTGAGETTYSLYTGYAHLGAGLTVGLSNLASDALGSNRSSPRTTYPPSRLRPTHDVPCESWPHSLAHSHSPPVHRSLSWQASGLAIGMCGNCGVQDSCRQPKLYIGMVLIWSFGSALGLYGLIVALIIATKDASELCLLH